MLYQIWYRKLEPEMGLEPIASRLQGERTTIVLSRQMKGRVLIREYP